MTKLSDRKKPEDKTIRQPQIPVEKPGGHVNLTPDPPVVAPPKTWWDRFCSWWD